MQIYSLRDYCKTLDEFSETLKKVADVGYNIVQVSGTCAYEADWLKNELDKNGLKCVLTHISPMDLFNELDKTVEKHNILDVKTSVLVGMDLMIHRQNMMSF